MGVTIKNTISFPKFTFQEDLRIIASRIFIPIMQQNIDNQVALDGGALKPNNPNYTINKVKRGLSPKILIATGMLRSGFIYKDKGKNSVIVTLRSDRRSIGGYLQDMGKNFFGISTRMENSAVKYMKDKINEALKNGKRS